MSERWLVAAGDPAYVVVPGLVKPINCGSKERARLVAAAPDLLAALVSITNQLERIGDTRPHKDGQFIDEARAAIAKATGEHP